MPTPQEIAMQNQANQNRRQQEEQQEQQRRQGRNAGELGGNWNQTFGTPQVGRIQNPNPSWNKPASTPVPGSGSPIGGTGLIATGPSLAATGPLLLGGPGSTPVPASSIGGTGANTNPYTQPGTIFYDVGMGLPSGTPTGNGTGGEVIGGPPVGATGVIGGSQSDYNPLPTPSTLTGI